MILIRHGQSYFNLHYGATRVDPGIPDPQLTEAGRQQALAALETLRPRAVKRLIASPYTRALETAHIIAGALGLPIAVEPLVRERAAFTCDIGTPPAELARRWPRLSFHHLEERWWGHGEESEASLHERCLTLPRTHGGVARLARGGRHQPLGLHPRAHRRDPLERRLSRLRPDAAGERCDPPARLLARIFRDSQRAVAPCRARSIP